MEADALVFHAPRDVRITRTKLPELSAGELRVRTVLTAISPGTEMLVYRGEFPEGLQADATIAALGGSLAYPLSYGYCAVGRVEESSSATGETWRGRSVFAFQPHRSFFNALPDELIPLPDDLSLEDAVFLPNMETALGLVMDAAPLAGERVAVVGQGIVGLLTTSLLASFPLERLVAFDRYRMRRQAALDSGAHQSFPPEGLDEAGRSRFDLVFELSGSPAALDLAIALAGEEGRVVVGSWYGAKRAAVDLGGHFHRGRLTLISSQVSRLAPRHTGRWTKGRRLNFALELVRRVQPARYITHRFPLAQAGEAYRLIDKSPEKTIQVVLEYV